MEHDCPGPLFRVCHPGPRFRSECRRSSGAVCARADSQFFHGDATSSFKEVRFGEANVQLTFHENDTKTLGGEKCVSVEPDIDYYKNLGAHALLEVIYNQIPNSLSDPTHVYVLR